MDDNQNKEKDLGAQIIDAGNTIFSSFNLVKNISRLRPGKGGLKLPQSGSGENQQDSSPPIGGVMSFFATLGPVGWTVAIIIVLIILAFIMGGFGGGLGGGNEGATQTQPTPGQSGPISCGSPTGGTSGVLDYSIPIRDASVRPGDDVKQKILARSPDAQIQNYDTIVNRSIENGFNPLFMLTLWVEESGAGSGAYDDALGCDPSHPTTDIDKSLTCVFNRFRDITSFDDFMCIYGGDTFKEAPCTFNKENVNFPGGIKSVYGQLGGTVGGGGENNCTPNVSAGNPGDWPTSGTITQGPQGEASHARLDKDYGRQSLDIANNSGTPVRAAFSGEVTVHDCIIDGDCAYGWGGLGNSVEVKTTNPDGSFISVYGHLSKMAVKTGDKVNAGETVGYIGVTGKSSGPHLHWELRGARMEPPNIPQAITPLDCPTNTQSCSPIYVEPGKLNTGPDV